MAGGAGVIGWIAPLQEALAPHPKTYVVLVVALLCAAAWLANFITRKVLLRALRSALPGLLRSGGAKNDPRYQLGVISRLSNVVPALVLMAGVVVIPGLPENIVALVRKFGAAFIVLTVALAIRFLQMDNRRAAAANLAATLALAGTFLVIKYFEYAHKFHEGQLPGKFYTFQGMEGTNPHVFFSVYFLMTGLHGIHVLVGMGVITWVLARTLRNHFSAEYYTPVELTGLYWHLVDLIWIFLFPLFYLVG